MPGAVNVTVCLAITWLQAAAAVHSLLRSFAVGGISQVSPSKLSEVCDVHVNMRGTLLATRHAC
jgi:hypothetical protein